MLNIDTEFVVKDTKINCKKKCVRNILLLQYQGHFTPVTYYIYERVVVLVTIISNNEEIVLRTFDGFYL